MKSKLNVKNLNMNFKLQKIRFVNFLKILKLMISI